MFIERITQMLEMRAIQNKYETIHGRQPYNVSSWLSSPEYAVSMRSTLDMPKIDTLEYVYTYSMEKKILDDVKKKFDPLAGDEMGITFVDNGTQAIITLINMIKQHQYKKICILNPAYFSIAQALKAFEIDYDEVNLIRENGQYTLPFQQLLEADYDLIWFTSPVFSTSVYHSRETLERIHELMDRGTLIISDECFCVPGHEVLPQIKNRENFIAIYSPHKALCLNTFKFAAIVYPERFDMFIEHWVDVLTGNLPASALSAINHFLSPNYDTCLNAYKKHMEEAKKAVEDIIKPMDFVESDQIKTGSLMTLYFNNLTFEQIKSQSFMEGVMNTTGKTFYPSYVNGLDESFGFAFRVNLALCDATFLSSLDKLVGHLASI